MKLCAIHLDRHDVRFERYQTGDATDLRIGLRIGPGRQLSVADIVIAAQPFVRAKGLVFQRVRADSSMSARGTYQRGAKPDS
jgi:hypothetical protein